MQLTKRNRFIPDRVWLLIVLALAFCVSLLWMAAGDTGKRRIDPNAPRNYTYGEITASNGMELHYLRTRPSNLRPEIIHNNVTLTPYYGINGGFFYQKELLSIAVVNDAPVNPTEGTYGDGGTNIKYARGTLVWDGKSDRLSVQVASRASELTVSDRSHYWAQGGISMSLSRNESWSEQAMAENAPFADEERLRSAAVYDVDGNLYLIVSSSKGTLAVFREAILEKVGYRRLSDGIFLDGDGSSQLLSREAELRGDGRPVVQMLRLIQ